MARIEIMPKDDGWAVPDRGEFPVQTQRLCMENVAVHPYPLPDALSKDLTQAWDYWNNLKRGNAAMPFVDDVKLGELKADQAILIKVFRMPQRFCVEFAGQGVGLSYGGDLLGKFVDELPARPPLNYFLSQCSATVEARAPTGYLNACAKADIGSYQRILLPLWADGHVAALLGAVGAPVKEIAD